MSKLYCRFLTPENEGKDRFLTTMFQILLVSFLRKKIATGNLLHRDITVAILGPPK